MHQETETAPVEGFRLSPQQQRIWSVKDRYGGRGPWAVAIARIRGALEVDRWQEALSELHRRYEILRTRFLVPPGSSMPLQVIDEPHRPWSFGAPPEASARVETLDQALDRIVAEAFAASYNPASDPVLHAEIHEIAEQEALLILRVPSLVCDALGMRRLTQELVNEYRGCRHEEPPLQYADLAEWQNELLESEETAAGRQYWHQRTASDGADEGFRMPFGRDEAGEMLEPRTLSADLCPELVLRLEALAEEADADLESLLALIWQGLLQRLGGGQGRGIAGAFAGRRYDELAGAVGTFDRYLPVFSDLDAGEPCHRLLQDYAQRWREAREWQEYFDVKSGLSTPFLYRFIGASEELRSVAEGVLELLRVRVFDEDFAMTLEATRSDDHLRIELHFDAGRFQREEAELIVHRFVHMMESFAAAPRDRLDELELLPELERQRLLFELDTVPEDIRQAESFLARFAQCADTEPERPAVRVGKQSMSYGELHARACRWGWYLRSLGVGPETTVALCLERSVDQVAALLGILEAGAAYLAVEPETPVRRMASMLRDGAAAWVITDAATAVPTTEARVVPMDDVLEDVLRQPAEPIGESLDPSRLVYVMFTSGSTGRPKGVGVEHRQLSAYLQGVGERLEVPAGSSFATVTTFAADLGHTAVFSALASGGCLHVIPRELVLDAHQLAEEFRNHPVDCLKIVPSHLAALMAYAAPRDLLPRRTLVLGGETAPWDLVERLQVLAPELRILNHYGPTESTVGVTTYRVPDGGRSEESWAQSVPIGQPMKHALIRLLDGGGQPVPLGAAGEIYIGGVSVARGYLGNPAATAERFVPDPYSREPGERLYRTGDRARRAISGNLEFLGRVDDQLKIRGFRVEPGEIASVLEEHSGVVTARVLAQETESGDARLVAYVAVDAETASVLHRWLRLQDAGELRGQALHELPNGMAVAHLNANETRFLYDEIFRHRTYLRHGLRLPKDARIFDVGANIGIFSLWALRVAPTARVFAFEPVPSVARVLQMNARVFGADRIQVFEHGLSNEDQWREMSHYPHLSMMSSLYADEEQERKILRAFVRERDADSPPDTESGSLFDELLEDRLTVESTEVRLRRISDVVREQDIDRIDLLKIDVQKSELDVLEGIDEKDWAKIHQIVVEVHDLESRLKRVVQRLESMGFEVEVGQEAALTETPLHDVYARRRDTSVAGASREDAAVATEARGWEGPTALTDALRESLEGRLPEHMIPSELVLLSHLPLTANGKLDKDRLPEPGRSLLGEAKRRQAPRNQTEQRLKEIWHGVLGHDHFGVLDNFFEVGGHSLLAAQVIARVRDDFDVSLPLGRFFSDPSIEALSQHLQQAEKEEKSTEDVATIQRVQRDAYRRG